MKPLGRISLRSGHAYFGIHECGGFDFGSRSSPSVNRRGPAVFALDRESEADEPPSESLAIRKLAGNGVVGNQSW